MAFNFKSTKLQTTTYTKEGGGGGQNWDFKYRAGASKTGKAMFYFSNKLWDMLGLDTMALVERDSYDDDGNITGVALAVVSNDRGTLKTVRNVDGEAKAKTKSFSSDVLEAHLAACNVIDPESDENQFMSLQYLGQVADATAKELEMIEEEDEGDAIYEIIAAEVDEDNSEED